MIEITPLGDSALTVRFAQGAARSPNDLLAKVLAAKQAIDEAAIPGVVETTTSYSTVGVYLDMGALLGGNRDTGNGFVGVMGRIHEVLEQRRPKKSNEAARQIDIPVCFEAAFALDLTEVAQRTQLSVDQVVAKFCEAEYQVAAVGFTAGFPYLLGLPPELTTPRRERPRLSVPAGSVAIGNNQAGIYPMETPGGWNIIGRTPLVLFAASRNPVSLLSTGDRVRFRRINDDEFQKVRAEARE